MQVSIWHHVATGVLILGFIGIGWLRLNDCDLFNPDSPRYLIYAQSLAETGEYRAIDTPGTPLYTWRPPGLPLLLAPVLKFCPYDVVAAKWVVLLSGALLLLAVHGIASSTRGGSSGPLMVAVVGSSPMFLSLATEVLTEVPYTVGTLLVVYGLGKWDQENKQAGWTSYLIALVALSLTPLIRTIGVAVIVAVGCWSLLKRRRWKFLPAIAIAIAGLTWLALRSRQAPGTNYAGSLIGTIREQGLMAVIANAVGTLTFYASALPGVILPGLHSGQPFYSPMVVGPLPQLDAFDPLAGVLAVVLLALGFAGLWHQRQNSGLIVLFYIPLYVGCLAIWPWRHERFLWPLVPFVWAFLPAGCLVVGRLFPQSARASIRFVVVVGLVALCSWQAGGDLALVSTNQRFVADRDEFYRREAPGFYFSDWRQAGRWIQEHTPPHARLLSWQAAVGGTAHRFQRRVQFEALNPEQIRNQISSFPARYLVIANCQFGLGFSWQQVFADPEYTLTPVYNDRGVTVLEVGPNLTGVIDPHRYGTWVEERQRELDLVLAQYPQRTDLIIRKSDLLQERGDNSRAIELLEELTRRGVLTVKVCSSLGWLYLAERQYEQAERYLDLARGLPNAEPIAQSLLEGAQLARDRRTAPDASLDESDSQRIRRIQTRVASLHFLSAEREVEQILAKTPDHSDAHFWRGFLFHLQGDLIQAEAAYVRAMDLGSTDARQKLELLRLTRALHQVSPSAIDNHGNDVNVDPADFHAHVELARLSAEQGWSGRSLSILESARKRFGDRPEILVPLAEHYLKFARPEAALPLLRIAQEAWPYEKSVRQMLGMAEGALREPEFP